MADAVEEDEGFETVGDKPKKPIRVPYKKLAQ